jgi:hypothetical protein
LEVAEIHMLLFADVLEEILAWLPSAAKARRAMEFPHFH